MFLKALRSTKAEGLDGCDDGGGGGGGREGGRGGGRAMEGGGL